MIWRTLALWFSAVAFPWMGYYSLAVLDLARFVHRETPVLELERQLLGGASAPELLAPLMRLGVFNLLMVICYLSFYGVLLGLPAWLLTRHHDAAFRRLRRVWAWTAAAGYPIYFLLPTQSPYYRLDLYNHPPFGLSQFLALGALERGVAFRYDAFPSLHLAFALVAVLSLAPVTTPAVRRLAWVWFALLHVATLATGSHYLLDLAAGDLLAAAVWIVVPAEPRS